MNTVPSWEFFKGQRTLEKQPTQQTCDSRRPSVHTDSVSWFLLIFLCILLFPPPEHHRPTQYTHARDRQMPPPQKKAGGSSGEVLLQLSENLWPIPWSQPPTISCCFFSKPRGSPPICSSSHLQSLTHLDVWRLRTKERTLRCEWGSVLWLIPGK